VLLAGFSPVQAEPAGQIYQIGSNARVMGMGGVSAATGHDLSSLESNPAGLGFMQGRQIFLTQATLYGGAAFQYFSYGNNKAKTAGGWGLEFMKLGVSGGVGADVNGNPGASFGYAETGLGYGVGYRGVLVPELSVGTHIHMLNRSLGSASDSLAGVDIGTEYGPIFHDKITLGAVIQNAATYKKGTTDDSLPLTMRVGAAYRVAGPLVLALDIDSSRQFSFGTEYAFGIMALRAGMQGSGFTFGAGMLIRRSFNFDLAIVQNSTLGMSQRISLGYHFGAKSKKTKNTELVAKEYFDNATAELDKHHYLEASKSFDMAISLDSKLGDNGWVTKSKRLHALVKTMKMVDHPEYAESFGKDTPQTQVGHKAVLAYLDHDEPLAMLLAHAAYGQDVKEAGYQALLETLGALTKIPVRKEDALPIDTLVQHKLDELAKAMYGYKFDEAIKNGREAIELDPNNVLAWTRLGSAYFAAKDLINAKAAWNKALNIDPSNTQLREFMKQQGME
jgi:hypothetical protein